MLTFCLAITSILLLLPIIRVVIKQKKLKTLVAGMALHRVPTAVSAPINSAKKTTMVCHDPWVSFLLTAITAIGLIMYFSKFLRQTHLWYGFKFNNYCSLYLYFYNTCYFVPIKVADTHGRLHQFSMENRMHIDSVSLQKCLTWDTLHIEWKDVKIKIGNKCLALPSDITIPLKDKIRLRNVLNGKAPNLFILVKQGATYYHINPASGNLIETATTC